LHWKYIQTRDHPFAATGDDVISRPSFGTHAQPPVFGELLKRGLSPFKSLATLFDITHGKSEKENLEAAHHLYYKTQQTQWISARARTTR
jgi:hypothetical protein